MDWQPTIALQKRLELEWIGPQNLVLSDPKYTSLVSNFGLYGIGLGIGFKSLRPDYPE